MTLVRINKRSKDTRIVVAMSGGVDSSATAGLMVEAGYEVIGVTLQLYGDGMAKQSAKACCAGQDISDARRVAEILGFPHYVLNYENRFRNAVIDDFADSYMRGETPVPCIRCNQTVKFHDLLQTAKDLKADALVTGHYARCLDGGNGPELHRGTDLNKDQSYFLFSTTRGQLSFLDFPLGHMAKAETRRYAERFGLAIFDKPDSQDICFVPDGNYKSLLLKLRPEGWEPGYIVDLNGMHIGSHEGVAGFTVGQRRGLGIATGSPLYVIRIEPKTQKVVVGPKSALFWQKFSVTNLNWLGDSDLPTDGMELEVKIRSTALPVRAMIQSREDTLWDVILKKPELGTSPGQAAVFYQGERVLGGGWITRSLES